MEQAQEEGESKSMRDFRDQGLYITEHFSRSEILLLAAHQTPIFPSFTSVSSALRSVTDFVTHRRLNVTSPFLHCRTVNLALDTMTSSTTASQTELKGARIPLAWRDQCSAYVLVFSNGLVL